MTTAKPPRGPVSRTGRTGPQTRSSAYDMLKRAILSGELSPGQPLVEMSLAEWAGVSRTPIREALRRLEQDGLVHHSDGGLAVRVRSPEEILDIYETRIVLEATASRVAAERRTDHDIRLLRFALARDKDVEPTDIAAMVEANQHFHRLIWRASRNESLIDILERLNLHLGRYPGTTLSAPGRWDESLREHSELVDAIAERRVDDAYQVAYTHFMHARDIRLALFAEESFADG
jgi:DNA-binding GntR family transcriptional regulator